MSFDVGVNATVSISYGGGPTTVHVPANVSGTSPAVSRAARPIVLALGLANNLVGYAPSTGARSGFSMDFDIAYAITAANIAGFLGTASNITCNIQFGAAGGVSVANCFPVSASISGSEGGNLSMRIAYESTSLPVVGTTVTSIGSSTDVFKFSDVTSVKLCSGTVYTDVSAFSWDIMNNLAKFNGNSTTGIPKHQKLTHTEASMSATVLKTGDGEGTAFLGAGGPNYCPTTADCVINILQICGGSAPLTLTTSAAFYQDYPSTSGATEDYIRESVKAQAVLGAYSVA